MQIRNPQYHEQGTIDCEIEHPDYGWMPFTASPDDEEEHGRQIYVAALAMGPAPYVPPPEPTPEEIHAQELAAAQAQRHAAYTEEADPLFFKYQRGEATEQEWLDKIEEIRARYPYPEDE